MGLDWNPGNKPKPGHEQEFRKIVIALADDKLAPEDRPPLFPANWSDVPKWMFKRRPSKNALAERYDEISIPAYATFDAPRIGFSAAADEWAKKMHSERHIPKPLDAWMGEMRGFHVLALVPPCDGIPFYSNGSMASYVELCSFRAQFLKSCRSIIGEQLFKEAYTLKFPSSLLAYASRLIASAEDYARIDNLTIPTVPPDDTDSTDGQLHVVMSAGRWCQYWGERGHLLEPYF